MQDVSRAYPSQPIVGVGVVVWHNDRVLLIRRGKPPRAGQSDAEPVNGEIDTQEFVLALVLPALSLRCFHPLDEPSAGEFPMTTGGGS